MRRTKASYNKGWGTFMRLSGFLIFLLVIIAFFSVICAVPSSKSHRGMEQADMGYMLPGEQFIRNHMVNRDGTLKTNLKARVESAADRAQGEDTLSESLGLWLQYAVEKGEQVQRNCFDSLGAGAALASNCRGRRRSKDQLSGLADCAGADPVCCPVGYFYPHVAKTKTGPPRR